MKKELLFMMMLFSPALMAAEVNITGPTIGQHSSPYSYEAIAKRDNGDKKKGELVSKVYEWHLLGSAIGKVVTTKTERAEIITITIPDGKFPEDSRLWPKATISCTVRFNWKKSRQTQKTSNTIDMTVTPNVNGEIQN